MDSDGLARAADEIDELAASVVVGAAEVLLVSLPLRTPHVAAHGTETTREVVLVRVVTGPGHEGWGECPALSAPGYTEETAVSAFEVLTSSLVPSVLAEAWDPDPRPAHPMAYAAVEAALLDAALRTSGRSLAALWGVEGHRVPRCQVVTPDPAAPGPLGGMEVRVADAVRSGAVMAKVKVGPGTDPGALEALVASAGVPVAADANASLAGHDTAAEALAATGVVYLEQPCAAGDLAASARLAARTAVPIALDESLGSPAAVAAALAAGAGSLVNCKPARLGGLAAALRCAAVATAHGAGLFVGGLLETGVGRAPALALAAALAPAGTGGGAGGGGVAAGVPWCTDLGPSAQYFTRDLTPPVEVDATGALRVRGAPGTGAAPDPEVVAAATVRRWAEEPW